MKRIKNFVVSGCLLMAFAVWTMLVWAVDVAAIGPRGSLVGFSAVNGFFHALIGVHMDVYTITDWLGLVPIAFAMGFAVLGLVQWIQRKNIGKVDYSILVLGGFYIVVMLCYFLFETVVINYRPTLINGYLEVSYPSSTTLLTLCVMPTAVMQLKYRMRNKIFRRCVTGLLQVFTVLMVVGRLFSGVHWFSDIVGGALLSAGLVWLYVAVCELKKA